MPWPYHWMGVKPRGLDPEMGTRGKMIGLPHECGGWPDQVSEFQQHVSLVAWTALIIGEKVGAIMPIHIDKSPMVPAGPIVFRTKGNVRKGFRRNPLCYGGEGAP